MRTGLGASLRDNICSVKYFALISAMLLLGFLTTTAIAYAGESVKRDCKSDSEQHIADLLGCCGDVLQSYPGTEVERMTAAIDAIDSILRNGCVDHKSPEYLAILLDRAGAYLARGRARTSQERDPRALINQCFKRHR